MRPECDDGGGGGDDGRTTPWAEAVHTLSLARRQGEGATRQPASRTDGRNRRTDARAWYVIRFNERFFGGRVRRAHSAIVRSATELLLGAHQLSGVRRRRRDNALSPPARPPALKTARPSRTTATVHGRRSFQPRRRASVAPPVVVALARRRGEDSRARILIYVYTYIPTGPRVGVRMCVCASGVTWVWVCASGVSHALISTPAAALTLVYIYIYKRINTPYAPDLNPPPPSPPYVFAFPSTRRSAVSPPSSRLSRSLLL